MKAETLKMIHIRNMLLVSLNIMFPSPLSMKTLLRSIIPFDRHYDWRLLEKDMTYLEEEGYIEYIDKLIGGAYSFEEKVAKITVKGKKLIEGTIIDEAMNL